MVALSSAMVNSSDVNKEGSKLSPHVHNRLAGIRIFSATKMLTIWPSPEHHFTNPRQS